MLKFLEELKKIHNHNKLHFYYLNTSIERDLLVYSAPIVYSKVLRMLKLWVCFISLVSSPTFATSDLSYPSSFVQLLPPDANFIYRLDEAPRFIKNDDRFKEYYLIPADPKPNHDSILGSVVAKFKKINLRTLTTKLNYQAVKDVLRSFDQIRHADSLVEEEPGLDGQRSLFVAIGEIGGRLAIATLPVESFFDLGLDQERLKPKFLDESGELKAHDRGNFVDPNGVIRTERKLITIWDCPECRLAEIPGVRRTCPACGYAMTSRERNADRFSNIASDPDDMQLLAAADSGPDWFCHWCDAANPASSFRGSDSVCHNCGMSQSSEGLEGGQGIRRATTGRVLSRSRLSYEPGQTPKTLREAQDIHDGVFTGGTTGDPKNNIYREVETPGQLSFGGEELSGTKEGDAKLQKLTSGPNRNSYWNAPDRRINGPMERLRQTIRAASANFRAGLIGAVIVTTSVAGGVFLLVPQEFQATVTAKHWQTSTPIQERVVVDRTSEDVYPSNAIPGTISSFKELRERKWTEQVPDGTRIIPGTTSCNTVSNGNGTATQDCTTTPSKTVTKYKPVERSQKYTVIIYNFKAYDWQANSELTNKTIKRGDFDDPVSYTSAEEVIAQARSHLALRALPREQTCFLDYDIIDNNKSKDDTPKITPVRNKKISCNSLEYQKAETDKTYKFRAARAAAPTIPSLRETYKN